MSDSPNFAVEGSVVDNGTLRVLKVIGRGSYGTVLSAADTSTTSSGSKLYAIKKLTKERDEEGSRFQRQELDIHSTVSDCPHIATLHRAFETEDHIHMVLDFIPGGNLTSAIHEKGTYLGHGTLTRQVFTQLIDALAYCHSLGIAHRDLKPANILCSADGRHWYLTDFGLASTSTQSQTFMVGTKATMAPEVLDWNDLTPYDPRLSDIFSLGVIFVNVLTSLAPWRKAVKSNPNYAYFVENRDCLSLMLPLSRSMGAILSRVLDPIPGQRMSLRELRHAIATADRIYPSYADLEVLEQYQPEALKVLDNYHSFQVKYLEKCAVEAAEAQLKTPAPVPQVPLPLTRPVAPRAPLRLVNPDLVEVASEHHPVPALSSTPRSSSDSSRQSTGPVTPPPHSLVGVDVATKKHRTGLQVVRALFTRRSRA